MEDEEAAAETDKAARAEEKFQAAQAEEARKAAQEEEARKTAQAEEKLQASQAEEVDSMMIDTNGENKVQPTAPRGEENTTNAESTLPTPAANAEKAARERALIKFTSTGTMPHASMGEAAPAINKDKNSDSPKRKPADDNNIPSNNAAKRAKLGAEATEQNPHALDTFQSVKPPVRSRDSKGLFECDGKLWINFVDFAEFHEKMIREHGRNRDTCDQLERMAINMNKTLMLVLQKGMKGTMVGSAHIDAMNNDDSYPYDTDKIAINAKAFQKEIIKWQQENASGNSDDENKYITLTQAIISRLEGIIYNPSGAARAQLQDEE